MRQNLYNRYSRSGFRHRNHWVAFHFKAIMFLFLLFLIFSVNAWAQTTSFSCNDPNRCTSKDLEVLDAYVEGVDQCFSCTVGDSVTKTLYMKIANKTGSIRAAFALFGTLNNARIIGQPGPNVFLCVGPINAKDTPVFAAGQIKFKCGDRLTLTNNYLAWTDASGTKDARCAVFATATKCSDIAPKCGTASEIVIRTPLNANATTPIQPCIGATTGGSITITCNGGTAPYAIVVAKNTGTTCPSAPATSDIVATFTRVRTPQSTGSILAEGNYCIYVTDSTSPTRCTFKFLYTVVGKQCCTPPPKPKVTATTAGICGDGKVSLTVCNAVIGDTYTLIQGVNTYTRQAAHDTVKFVGLTPGGGFKVYGVDTVSGTTCVGPYTASCDSVYASCDAASPGIASRDITDIRAEIISQQPPTVIAAPNPFNDRIRFTLKSDVSGQGSLELYNMLGQRMKVVYQGQIKAGQVQSVDYSVPYMQRTNLIYLFQVGNQKTSGKLIGLKQ